MFAISIESRRGRGHLIACDLLRVVLRCRSTGVKRARLVAAGVGLAGRLSDAFSGYLVTECDVGAGYPFRSSRAFYVHNFDYYCATSSRVPLGLRVVAGDVEGGGWCQSGGPIDAPVMIAAGSFDYEGTGSYFWRAGE